MKSALHKCTICATVCREQRKCSFCTKCSLLVWSLCVDSGHNKSLYAAKMRAFDNNFNMNFEQHKSRQPFLHKSKLCVCCAQKTQFQRLWWLAKFSHQMHDLRWIFTLKSGQTKDTAISLCKHFFFRLDFHEKLAIFSVLSSSLSWISVFRSLITINDSIRVSGSLYLSIHYDMTLSPLLRLTFGHIEWILLKNYCNIIRPSMFIHLATEQTTALKHHFHSHQCDS